MGARAIPAKPSRLRATPGVGCHLSRFKRLMVREADAAYLAATLDMEGTLGLYKPKAGGVLAQITTVHNTDWKLVSYVAQICYRYGISSTLGESGNHKRNPNHNICWRLRVSGREGLLRYLELVLPYIQSDKKRRDAEKIQQYLLGKLRG